MYDLYELVIHSTQSESLHIGFDNPRIPIHFTFEILRDKSYIIVKESIGITPVRLLALLMVEKSLQMQKDLEGGE